MNILDFKNKNILFEWIFWILKKRIFCLNEYSGFFIKWIVFWTNILVLVCSRQKWLSPNVLNSSEIIQGSLVGPISVHFRGPWLKQGASGGLQNHILAFFYIEWFSSKSVEWKSTTPYSGSIIRIWTDPFFLADDLVKTRSPTNKTLSITNKQTIVSAIHLCETLLQSQIMVGNLVVSMLLGLKAV